MRCTGILICLVRYSGYLVKVFRLIFEVYRNIDLFGLVFWLIVQVFMLIYEVYRNTHLFGLVFRLI